MAPRLPRLSPTDTQSMQEVVAKVLTSQPAQDFEIDWNATDIEDPAHKHAGRHRHPSDSDKFAFSTAHLHQLSQARSLNALDAFGGIQGLAKGLRSDLDTGLGVDEDRLDGTITRQDALVAGGRGTPPSPQPPAKETTISFTDHARPRLLSRSTQQDITHIADRLHVPNPLNDGPKRYTDRRNTFGENRLPKPKSKSFLELAWLAFNDKLIFLLLTSATVSLALGIYEAVASAHDDPADNDGSNLEWVESVTIMAAVLVIVFASAANDYHKNYRFQKLNQKKKEGWETVKRSGSAQRISVFDVLVGDVLMVEAGDILQADGILVEGSGVQCDESSLTGEAEIVPKAAAKTHIVGLNQTAGVEGESQDGDDEPDVFVFSGTKVVHGVGAMLVTAVGTHSQNGRIQLSLRGAVEQTPLQKKLGKLAKYIIVVGFIIGSAFFLAQFIRWCVNLPYFEGEPEDKGESFLKIFMVAVTVVVIGVPEGLSLAVAVALAFGTSRMLRENNLVRLLRSCEVMGNATTICSDKTGTLTQNKMSVVAGVVGREQFGSEDIKLHHILEGGKGKSKTNIEESRAEGTSDQAYIEKAAPSSVWMGVSQFATSLHASVRELIREMVALNTTAFEQTQGGSGNDNDESNDDTSKDPSRGDIFIGTGTETALLHYGRDHLGMDHLATEKKNADIVEMLPFNPIRKWMGVVIRLRPDTTNTESGSEHQDDRPKYRLLVKGAAEIVLDYCTTVLDKPHEGLSTIELDSSLRDGLTALTTEYARRQLRPIALAYKDFTSWPSSRSSSDDDDGLIESLCNDLAFVGTLGIHDPLRPEAVDAVRQCQTAGIFVRMVTGDNIETAKSIAQECGIYTAGGIAMDGPAFRNLAEAELDLVVPRLQVLARSSPDDKRVLVRHLRKLGETVAVTGDGTNDAFALKAADVGFAMGISGTDVAKEASAIILMDDNFASIVSALGWGRVINDSAKKFCQFQFTINITAGLLTIVTTLVESVDAAVFAVIQLLWLNLIMDIFAALALATDFPTKTLLSRRPEPRDAPIITPTMWKMVLGQAVYQLIVIFTLHYAGFEYFMGAGGDLIGDEGYDRQRQMQTFVFNCYMFMQVSNQTNCRRTDNRLNVFEGIHRNPWFCLVQVITIGGQIAIVLKGGQAFQTEPLTAAQWGWSIFFGILTFPVGAAIRCIPDSVVLYIARKWLKPLAWPITRIVRWSRQRKIVKRLEKEVKAATEAAAAERARLGLEPDDEVEEGDEERQLRRMQWRLRKKKLEAGPKFAMLPRKRKSRSRTRSRSRLPRRLSMRSMSRSRKPAGEAAQNDPDTSLRAEESTISSQPQDMKSADKNTIANYSNNEKVAETRFVENLRKRISRVGDNERVMPSEISGIPQEKPADACFQLHPDTRENDPIFAAHGLKAKNEKKVPPSQDPDVLRYLGVAREK